MVNLCGVLFPFENNKSSNNDDLSVISKPIPYRDDDEYISPFIAYNDGYKWPDLFSELDECIESSILVYALAELRKMARQRDLVQPAKILSTPISHRQVMDYVIKNKEKLVNTKLAEVFFEDLLQLTEDRNMAGSGEKVGKKASKVTANVINIRPTRIIAFDDDFEQEELVYAIEVNQVNKRITVTFRGSTTKRDFAADFEIYMKEVANPVKHSTQKPAFKVHKGFFNYLFQPSARAAKGPHGKALSAYEEILQEHVLPVMKKHPGFKLYVTGHSLGGALATLFGFAAAALPDSAIPKPVSVFSIASPYVGDSDFRSAHQVLESQGKLRHLRVSNYRDLITTVPKISFRMNLLDSDASVGSPFKHVGMNLRLYDGYYYPFEVQYPQVHSGYMSSVLDELSRGWDQALFANWTWNLTDYVTWPNHSLREYNKRVQANKPALQSMQLNDLYSRRDIVGSLVPNF